MTLVFIVTIFLAASAGFVFGWAMGARVVRANYEALDDPTELHADAKSVSSRRDYRRPF
jgi:hypothetical protein